MTDAPPAPPAPPRRAELKSRIGLLGGSFNPAHDGHREISVTALERFSLDAVWWLVTPGNPLKDKSIYAGYEDRLARAREVAQHPNIIVSDFERRRNLQYTAETLAALTDQWPSANFIWLMGADSLENFHLWKDWRSIVERLPIAVFNRPGHETAPNDAPVIKELSGFRLEFSQASTIFELTPPAWIFVPTTANPRSSTEIRGSWQS